MKKHLIVASWVMTVYTGYCLLLSLAESDGELLLGAVLMGIVPVMVLYENKKN